MSRLLKRTLAATALAAAFALVPARTDAATIVDCLESSCVGFFAPDGEDVNVYDFGSYRFIVGFDEVLAGFSVGVTTAFHAPGSLGSRLPDGMDCVPIAGVCVEFIADPGDAEPESHWAADSAPRRGLNIGVEWDLDTNAEYPSPVLLHDRSDVPGDFFGEDMTANEGIYCGDEGFTDGEGESGDCTMDFFTNGGAEGPPPVDLFEYESLLSADDPANGGRTDDFCCFIIAAPTVPEPSTILLLTCVGAAAWSRHNRRRRA